MLDRDHGVSRTERLIMHGGVGITGVVILWDTAALTGASAIFPRAIGGALVVVAIISAITALKTGRKESDEASLAKGLPGLVLLALYVFGSVQLGFLTSALWFIPALSLLGGERRPGYIALLTAGFIALMFLVFVLLFNQQLPPEFVLGGDDA